MEYRDWKSDMEIIISYKKNRVTRLDEQTIKGVPVTDVIEHWLKQSIEWKTTAYKADVKYYQEKERADKVEEREQKLKEAIEIAIRDGGKYENPYESLVYLQSVLASIYPR